MKTRFFFFRKFATVWIQGFLIRKNCPTEQPFHVLYGISTYRNLGGAHAESCKALWTSFFWKHTIQIKLPCLLAPCWGIHEAPGASIMSFSWSPQLVLVLHNTSQIQASLLENQATWFHHHHCFRCGFFIPMWPGTEFYR